MIRLNLAFAALLLVVFPGIFFAGNPFTPPENIQLFEQVIYPDATQPPIDYKMYLQSAGKNIAVLNTAVVAEGDQFEGNTVMSINARRVILRSASGEKRVVVIDALQSKVSILRTALTAQDNAVK